MLNLSSYEAIASEINEVIAALNANNDTIHITAQDIGFWILRQLIGDDLSLLQTQSGAILTLDEVSHQYLIDHITHLNHLLFLTEGVRSPAGRITNLLALQSMDENRWDEIGPMSVKGAVQSTRFLHALMKDYIPYTYEYPGSSLTPNTKHLQAFIESNAELYDVVQQIMHDIDKEDHCVTFVDRILPKETIGLAPAP